MVQMQMKDGCQSVLNSNKQYQTAPNSNQILEAKLNCCINFNAHVDAMSRKVNSRANIHQETNRSRPLWKPTVRGSYGNQPFEAPTETNRSRQLRKPTGRGSYGNQPFEAATETNRLRQLRKPTGRGRYGNQPFEAATETNRSRQLRKPTVRGSYGNQPFEAATETKELFYTFCIIPVVMDVYIIWFYIDFNKRKLESRTGTKVSPQTNFTMQFEPTPSLCILYLLCQHISLTPNHFIVIIMNIAKVNLNSAAKWSLFAVALIVVEIVSIISSLVLSTSISLSISISLDQCNGALENIMYKLFTIDGLIQSVYNTVRYLIQSGI